MNGFDFRGKNAVITGAGSGIGRSLALELTARGINGLALCDIREHLVEATAEEARAGGADAGAGEGAARGAGAPPAEGGREASFGRRAAGGAGARSRHGGAAPSAGAGGGARVRLSHLMAGDDGASELDSLDE